MVNFRNLIIEHFVKELKFAYIQTYSLMEPQYANLLEWTGRLALENIANSDSLYHNMDHTIMVALVGQAILKGKHLREGGVHPRDWLHYMMALLCHDIGYVKGVCQVDTHDTFATGINDEVVTIEPEGTDASLTPFHVDRSKLFIYERFGNKELLVDMDPDVITSYIEMTRFPVPDEPFYEDTCGFGGLTRAADFIGQLGDPNYLRKVPALFYEFEETGENVNTGYKSPGHMRRNYTTFYWKVVRPRIQDAMAYLRITQDGKQWIANLHSHVFDIQHNHQ
ncbi:MAG: metal-dependent phosphohydrolase [Chloroflexi bacterium]|nr:metal-dependent phosphohydrolase [Chloroflexota bacterium]